VAALLLASAWHVPAAAWNDVGHRAAALIAYDALSDEVRARAVALLHAHPRFAADFAAHLPPVLRQADAAVQDRWYFAYAATWPDVAREFSGVRPEAVRLALVAQYHRPHWHYINLPTYLSDADRRLHIAAPSLAESPELPDAALNIVQALTRVSRTLCRGELAAPQRALALSWLLHLMADVHQPLHATALYAIGRFPEGDRGGNDIVLADALAVDGNLHTFWDAAAGDEADWPALPRAPHVPMTFADIARRSRELAAVAAYAPSIRAQLLQLPPRTPVTIDAGYVARSAAIARAQLALSGVRTAQLLNALLAPGGKCLQSLAFYQGRH
jgi:S1/P1 Nuclease